MSYLIRKWWYKYLLQQHEKKEDDYVVLDDTPKVDVPTIPHDVQQY